MQNDIIILQELSVGSEVLLRNSRRDSKKGDRLKQKWTGPYIVAASLGKSRYRLKNSTTGATLKQAVHKMRLKTYFRPNETDSCELAEEMPPTKKIKYNKGCYKSTHMHASLF